MEALTLHQPYANWVADGSKLLETRTWTTKHRGDLLICAGLAGDGEPHGVALCIVTVGDIRPMTPEDEPVARIAYRPELFVWQLSDVRPTRRVHVRGRQQIFRVDVPDDIELMLH